MKIPVPGLVRIEEKNGSVLLAVLGFAAVVLICVVPFFYKNISSQNISVARSERWNTALPIVESGVEEAMAHLNRNCIDPQGLKFVGMTSDAAEKEDWTADGWRLGANEYTLVQPNQRTINIGSQKAYYEVRILTNETKRYPQIVSVGYTPAPYSGNSSNTNQSYVARQVRAFTVRNIITDAAVKSQTSIAFSGKCEVDSFDSQNTNYSNGGIYDSTRHLDNAPLVAIDGNIDLGGGKAYGTAETGATNTATGTIGSTNWIDSGQTGIEPGKYQQNVNDDLHQVEAPSGPFKTPFAGTVVVTNQVTESTQLTSPIYPNPAPASGVTTNTALVTTDFYPNPVPATGVTTNTTTVAQNTAPDPMPTALVTTNTDYFTSISYPTGLFYGFVQTNATGITNLTYPSAGTYVGSVTNIADKVKGKWTTNYAFAQIVSYSYQTIVYSWQEKTYTYLWPQSYTYTGSQTNFSYSTNSYDYVLGNGQYKVADFSPNGQVIVTGNAVLYITGDMKMTGQSQIIIRPGASLIIYAAGDVDLAGQGFLNQNNSAMNLSLYGLPTCTSISIGGNAGYTGVIYAPNADVKLHGGGNNEYDVVGSITGKSVDFVGHFHLHYDEALSRNGPAIGYAITSWMEERVGTTP